MIRKIIFSSFFVLLLFSISLYLFGVRRVELGSAFLSFLKNCSRELESFKIAIPNIPHIPDINVVDNEFLQAIKGIVMFLNGLVDVINFLILVINTIISIVQFLIILLKNFITTRDILINGA